MQSSDSRPVYIYALADPRTGEDRYVGKTVDLCKRLSLHTSARRLNLTGHTYRSRWIQTLLAAGLRPQMRVLEVTTVEEWPQAERRWIASLREAGARLTNHGPGGEGGGGLPKGYKFRPEVIAAMTERLAAIRARQTPEMVAAAHAKIGDALRGRKRPPEVREKIAAVQRGKPRNPESIAKGAATRRGRKQPRHAVEQRANALRGKPRTEEVKRKIAAGNRGRIHTAESRRNMSLAHIGIKMPPRTLPQEVRDKISRTRKRRFVVIRERRERKSDIAAAAGRIADMEAQLAAALSANDPVKAQTILDQISAERTAIQALAAPTPAPGP